ncbi:hypothetical protein MMC07_005738 [Pseudocyphellaria aurata]|nr:hypothetical protein [Pseudocyphellaria aurata]
MQDLTPTRPLFQSPKRKRSDHSLGTESSPSRLKTTNLPARPSGKGPLTGEGSPHATVASRFQKLDLNGPNSASKHALRKSLDGSMREHPPSQRSSGLEDQTLLLAPASLPNSEGKDFMKYGTSPSALRAAKWQSPVDAAPASRLEIPETPRLKPALSPSPTLSPLLSRAKPPRSASPTLWWTETEITGHNPKDPMDDGYGINGVGFLPTPAIAHARAERRRRQVVEWKNREAREARQKRSEMRRRRYVEDQGLGTASAGMPGGEVRKVRFLET